MQAGKPCVNLEEVLENVIQTYLPCKKCAVGRVNISTVLSFHNPLDAVLRLLGVFHDVLYGDIIHLTIDNGFYIYLSPSCANVERNCAPKALSFGKLKNITPF